MTEHRLDIKLSENVKDLLKQPSLLKAELAMGKPAQEILEIPDAQMQLFYKMACQLFEKQRYAAAVDGFLFLIGMNAYQREYWLGLGMALQMCGNFEMAIDAYETATIYEIENPVPYFYLAKCLFAMHERQSALLALDMAIQYAGEIAEYQELKVQALEAKEQLGKHLS
jgi:type III secretion system low calcium response chaperone LcrH/SycD